MSTAVEIVPVPLTGTIGCCVPVLPGTGDTDADLADRSELCAVDANWIVGAVPTCDVHLKLFCELGGIDWPGVVAETSRGLEKAERPWADRQRHSQADARKHYDHFMPS